MAPSRHRTVDRDEGPEAPEALVISALVELGEFPLADYRLSPEDFGCWQPLMNFCVEHHAATGKAPSIGLVKRKYPEFEITPDVDPHWAAGQLRIASSSREMRLAARAMLDALGDEDVHSAYAAIENLQPLFAVRQPPRDGFDATDVEDDDVPMFNVPWNALARVVGGVRSAELWYFGARPGYGKSAVGGKMLSKAVQDGGHVAIWSCEMPANQVNRRMRRCLSAKHPDLQLRLEDEDRFVRKEALDELKELVPGSFHTFDPSMGDITVEAVRDSMRDYDYVMVDHVGLLKMKHGNKSGVRAIDDWRVAATISNQLREATLSTKSSCLGLIQINREGEHNSPWRCPKLSELSQTDAFGQDGVIVITMQRFSKKVRLLETQKVREGDTARWFTRFDPKRGIYDQITQGIAEQQAALDDDAEMIQR